MTSEKKIIVEADLGCKGVEKTDIYVYEGPKLIDTFFDMTFDDIRKIARDMKERHKDADAFSAVFLDPFKSVYRKLQASRFNESIKLCRSDL